MLTEPLEPAGVHPSETAHPVRTGMIHVGAITGALGAAALVAQIPGGVAWPLGAFAATLVYLLGNGVAVLLESERREA